MPQKTHRNAAIETAYRAGRSLSEVAEEFGIGRERVRQVLKARNVDRRSRGYPAGRRHDGTRVGDGGE